MRASPSPPPPSNTLTAYCQHHCSTPPHDLPHSGNDTPICVQQPSQRQIGPLPHDCHRRPRRCGGPLWNHHQLSPPGRRTLSPSEVDPFLNRKRPVRSKDPGDLVPAYYKDLLGFIIWQGMRSFRVMERNTSSRSTSSCRSTPQILSLYLVSVRAPHSEGLGRISFHKLPLPACTSSAEGQVGFTGFVAGGTASRTPHNLSLVPM
jgi:hypothetical protein